MANEHGSEVVERTLLTCRSIEFDTVLVAGGVQPTKDIKLVLLLQEAYRHCKVIGAWGEAGTILESAGVPLDDPGVVIGRKVARTFTDELAAALGLHRVWQRAEAVMGSAVAPAEA